MDAKRLNINKWTARMIAVIIILVGLPFYFGYAKPIPFIKPEYSSYGNL